MTTRLKLGIGLATLVALFATILFLPTKASALTPTVAQANAAGPFEWIDSQRIKGKVNNEDIIFTLQNGYEAFNGSQIIGPAYVAGNLTCGDDKAYILAAPAGTTAGGDKVFISAQAGSGGSCTPTDKPIDVKNDVFRSSIVKWLDAGTIATVKDLGGIPAGERFTQRGTEGNYFRSGESECIDQIVVTGGRATVYELKPGPDEAPANEIGLPQFGNCEVLSINGENISSREEGRRLANQTFAVALPTNRTRPAGSAAADGAGAAVGEPSCESENGTGLEWMICPILVGIDGAVNGINNIILDQLEFNPEQDLGKSTTGGDGTSADNGVKVTWNIIKNISTFLVIIIMLIMVLSTAVSWGPFDAYAIRQILPRLVIAIIAMQLSWELLIFIIEFTNDVGRGLSDLMYAPFGGSQNMTLSALIGANTSEAAATTIFTTAVIGTAIAAAISPFGILVLAISALASIFIGILVLLVRNILIILCLMVAPLAIMAWVLPGTRNYWNYWQETFSKLMLMFPFIVALLASGRIFAHITGVSSTGDTFGGLINFLAVFIGIFGPYWLLPKTMQWGGRAFGNLAGTLNNAKTKGMFDRGKNFARQRGKELKAQRDAASGARLATGNAKLTDRLKSSQLDPTLRFGENAQRVRQQKLAGFIAAGRGLQQQQQKDAQNRLEIAIEGKSFGDSLTTLQAIAEDSSRTEYERRSAISMLTDFKGVKQIDQVRDELLKTEEGQRIWNISVGENFSGLKALSPHLAQDSSGMLQGDPTSGDPDKRVGWAARSDAGRAQTFTNENDELLSKMRIDGWAKFAALNPAEAQKAFDRIKENENINSNLNPAIQAKIEELRSDVRKRRELGARVPEAEGPGADTGPRPAGT